MVSYNALERFIHRIALDHSNVLELTFDLEKLVNSDVKMRDDAVYVTGLSRAGTTTMLNGLYGSGIFASATYLDMPFVLAPNLWAAITRFTNKLPISMERKHGDDVSIGYDSPEAFEEVFWRLRLASLFVKADHLSEHKISYQDIEALQIYQSLVCRRYKKQRYLCKNNNHIFRFDIILRLCPSSKFLIMFRNPLEQAESLLRQHRRFTNLDPFSKKYMYWLSHHEFGDTHLPYSFAQEPKQYTNKNSIYYWLEIWVDVYTRVLERYIFSKNTGALLVNYDRLCNSPDYWKSICSSLNLHNVSSPYSPKKARPLEIETSPILEKAKNVFEKLDSLIEY